MTKKYNPNEGYYWIKIKKLDIAILDEIRSRNTIGYYDGYEKWWIIGTSEMLVNKDVEVIEEVDHP